MYTECFQHERRIVLVKNWTYSYDQPHQDRTALFERDTCIHVYGGVTPETIFKSLQGFALSGYFLSVCISLA